jgi:DNA polymerase-3 subunit delta'
MSDEVHPKDRLRLERIENQAAAFEHALSIGRLHHAWMLTGPEGLGKASFAYRAARRLLGAKPDAAYGPLGAAPDDPVSRLIASSAHPDFLVLERTGEGARKVIPVDEARRLPEFFSKAPAMGPYRVAIIDAVDDFNANGANAVLKTLEEPSGRGVLFLISHAPGRLLPTIRSRCRTLAFRPWPLAATAAFVQARSNLNPEEAEAVAEMAGGSPGQAMALLSGDAVKLDQLARRIVESPMALERAPLSAFADSLRGGEGMARLTMFLERLAAAVRAKAASADPREAARWAEAWGRLESLGPRVEGLNLDRADAFWSAIRDLRAV